MNEAKRSQKIHTVERLVTFWVPKRFVTSQGVEAQAFLKYIDELIASRGIVLADGQIIDTPLRLQCPAGFLTSVSVTIEPEFVVFKPIDLGKTFSLQFEPCSEEPFEIPEVQPWSDLQRTYLKLAGPYQMSEEADSFTWANISGYLPFKTLGQGEWIEAIVHCEGNGRPFYCECHSANVVYTTQGRVICMGCGGIHLILRTAVMLDAQARISAHDFTKAFDEEVGLSDAEVNLAVVDFQFLDKQDRVWETGCWRSSRSEAEFFLNSSPKEIAEFLARTQVSPSMLTEMGWEEDESYPAPAVSVAQGEVTLDLLSNARISLARGLAAFVGAARDGTELLFAVQNLFHATELLMKQLLQDRDPDSIRDRPNNPTVIKRLAANGIALTDEDVEVVDSIRKLRNEIQHGSPAYSLRVARSTVRRSIVFLDRFIIANFGGWILDDCEPKIRERLLKITEISVTAEKMLQDKKKSVAIQGNTFEPCTLCGSAAVYRSSQDRGASCLLCGHIRRRDDDDYSAFES